MRTIDEIRSAEKSSKNRNIPEPAYRPGRHFASRPLIINENPVPSRCEKVLNSTLATNKRKYHTQNQITETVKLFLPCQENCCCLNIDNKRQQVLATDNKKPLPVPLPLQPVFINKL
jgi:hypothetical protein